MVMDSVPELGLLLSCLRQCDGYIGTLKNLRVCASRSFQDISEGGEDGGGYGGSDLVDLFVAVSAVFVEDTEAKQISKRKQDECVYICPGFLSRAGMRWKYMDLICISMGVYCG
jgi:hypothetical protein